jgi:hypothetical protein
LPNAEAVVAYAYRFEVREIITETEHSSSGPTRSKGNSAMSELTPMAVNRTLPLRRPNREYWQHEYLTAGAQSGMLRRSFWRIGMARGRRS